MLGQRNIRIELEGGRDQVFYPGAVIRGRVIYKVSTNDRLSSVSINLRGTEKVLGIKKSSISDPEYIEVFSIHEVLQKTSIWTEGKTLEWAFDMALPSTTGPDRSNPVDFYGQDASNELFITSPHSLAPTLTSAHSHTVRVEYQMYAVAKIGMRPSPRFGEGIAAASVCDVIDSLNYAPDVDIEYLQETACVRHTCELGTGHHPGWSARLRRGSQASTVSAKQDGDLAVDMPCRLVLGTGTTHKVAFTIQPKTDSKMPICVLKDISISLQASTHRRTKKVSHQASHTESKFYKLLVDNKTCTLSHDRHFCEFTLDKVKNLPSTFKSYNISRSYDLIVQARFISGSAKEKLEDVKVFTESVEIIKAVKETERLRRAERDLPPTVEFPIGPLEHDELPTYEMHRRNTLIGSGSHPGYEDAIAELTRVRPNIAEVPSCWTRRGTV